jgi:hypothetical protein
MKSAAGRSTETSSLGSGGGPRVVQELDGRGVRRKPAATSSWESTLSILRFDGTFRRVLEGPAEIAEWPWSFVVHE